MNILQIQHWVATYQPNLRMDLYIKCRCVMFCPHICCAFMDMCIMVCVLRCMSYCVCLVRVHVYMCNVSANVSYYVSCVLVIHMCTLHAVQEDTVHNYYKGKVHVDTLEHDHSVVGMVCLSNYSCSGQGMLSCRLHDCSCDRCLPLYYYIYIHACVYMCVCVCK